MAQQSKICTYRHKVTESVRVWERARDLVTFGTIHSKSERQIHNKKQKQKQQNQQHAHAHNEIQMRMRQNHNKVSGSVFELLGLG